MVYSKKENLSLDFRRLRVDVNNGQDFSKQWTLNSQASFASSLIRCTRQLSQTNLDNKAYVNLNESLARDSLLRIQSFIKTQLEESTTAHG